MGNSFRTYVIYGRQVRSCVDRVHDLPVSSCFHRRGCRDPRGVVTTTKGRRELFADSIHRSTTQKIEIATVRITRVSNPVWIFPLLSSNQRTLLPAWLRRALISWSLHIDTLPVSSTFVSSPFAHSPIKWKKETDESQDENSRVWYNIDATEKRANLEICACTREQTRLFALKRRQKLSSRLRKREHERKIKVARRKPEKTLHVCRARRFAADCAPMVRNAPSIAGSCHRRFDDVEDSLVNKTRTPNERQSQGKNFEGFALVDEEFLRNFRKTCFRTVL